MKKIFINKENISVLAASTSSNILEKVNIMMLTKHTTEKKRSLKTQMLIQIISLKMKCL